MYRDLDQERRWDEWFRRERRKQNATFASALILLGTYWYGALNDWSWPPLAVLLVLLTTCNVLLLRGPQGPRS